MMKYNYVWPVFELNGSGVGGLLWVLYACLPSVLLEYCLGLWKEHEDGREREKESEKSVGE